MELTKAEVIELGYTDKLIGVMLPEPRKKRMARGGYCLLWPEEVVKAGLRIQGLRECWNREKEGLMRLLKPQKEDA